MATLPSHSASPDETDDLLFREQCRRQMQRPLEARMKYGFCRVSRPGLTRECSCLEAALTVFDKGMTGWMVRSQEDSRPVRILALQSP